MPNSKIPFTSLGDTMNSFRNRHNQLVDSVGDLGLLETDVTETIVGSLNSLDSNLGERLELATTDKTDIVTAINENHVRLDSINFNELVTPRVYAQDSSLVNYFNGDVQMQSNMDLQGNAQVDGTLTVEGLTQLNGSVDLGDATSDTVSVTGRVDTSIVPSTNNTRDLGSSGLQFRDIWVDRRAYLDSIEADNISVTADVNVGGNLDVSDSARFANNMSIDGNLSVGGNTTMSGTLIVDGEVTFKAGTNNDINLGDTSGDNVVFNAEVNSSIIPNLDDTYDLGSASKQWNDLHVDGVGYIDDVQADTATVTGDLDVGGITTLDSASIDGSLTMNTDKFTVDYVGNLTAAGDAAISGNTDVTGNLTVDGNTTLGNATSDTVSVTGRVNTAIVPSTDNTRDLGTSSFQFRHAYITGTANIDNLAADSATVTGDLDVQGITTLDEATVDGTLNTTGTATFNSNVVIENDLRVEDSATITGALRVVGEVTSDSRAFFIQGDSAGTDQINFGDTVRVQGAQGINVRKDGSNSLHVEGEDASTANKGVASFSSDNFSVSSGVVTIKTDGIANAEILNDHITFADSNSTTDIALGGTVTFRGADNEIEVNHVGSTFNIGLPTDVDIDGNLTIGDNFTVGGNLILAGDQKTAGRVTEYLSEVASGATPTLDAGIVVRRGNQDSAQLLWNETSNYWEAGTTGDMEKLARLNDAVTFGNVDFDSARMTGGLTALSANVSTTLRVGGAATINGAATVNGAATLNGNVTLGNATTDTINPTGRFSGDLDPSANNARDMGASGLAWRNLWLSGTADISQLSADSAEVSGELRVGGNMDVVGDLTVRGTTTTVNSTTVTIADNVMLINSNQTGTPAVSLRSGLEVERGNSTNVNLQWNENGDYWEAAHNGSNTLSRILTTNDTTTNVTEGNNLYYTDDRVHGAVGKSGLGLTYNSSTGVFAHADTSSQASSNNSGRTYIQDIGVDSFGHVISLATASESVTNTTYNLDVLGGANPSLRLDANTGTDTSIKFKGTDEISVDRDSNLGLTISHDDVARTNTTATSSPAYGESFTAVGAVTTNARGHVTGVQTRTVNIPASDNTNTTYTFDAVTSAAGAILRLNPSSGADMDVLVKAGAGIGVARDSNNGLTISSTSAGTTYDFDAQSHTPASGTGAILRLNPSAGSNDDVQLTTTNGLVINRASATNVTINHADTSTLNGSYGRTGAEDGTYIKSITVDANGHLTAVTSDDFDDRYNNFTYDWSVASEGVNVKTMGDGDALNFTSDGNVTVTYTAVGNKFEFDAPVYTHPDHTGDVTSTGDGVTAIGALKVQRGMIAADAIDGTKIANDAINSEHYANGSIDHAHLSADCVDKDNLKTVVTLLIKNSAGTTLKTMYGAGA